jgi:hypothetical protein
LAKTPGTVEQADEIEKEFYGTNDRACGILFASWVELALDRALKSVFRPDMSKTLTKRIFEFDGSIGSFSNKIDVGYGLRIFGQVTYHDLDLIRAIRNEFAHCSLPLKFEIPQIAAVCEHLQILGTEHETVPPYF